MLIDAPPRHVADEKLVVLEVQFEDLVEFVDLSAVPFDLLLRACADLQGRYSQLWQHDSPVVVEDLCNDYVECVWLEVVHLHGVAVCAWGFQALRDSGDEF